jgi:hypothetical protein
MLTVKRLTYWFLASCFFSYIPYSEDSNIYGYLGLYVWLFSVFVIVDYFADKIYPSNNYFFDKPRTVIAIYIAFSIGLFLILKDVLIV